jgi:hypothetical protein
VTRPPIFTVYRFHPRAHDTVQTGTGATSRHYGLAPAAALAPMMRGHPDLPRGALSNPQYTCKQTVSIGCSLASQIEKFFGGRM